MANYMTKEQAEEARDWLRNATGKAEWVPPALLRLYDVLANWPADKPPVPEPEPPYLKERPFGTWPTMKFGWIGPELCQWCENKSNPAQGWWVEVPQINP